MRVRFTVASLSAAALLLGATSALAQPAPTPAPAPAKDTPKAAAPAKDAGKAGAAPAEPRRDPEGLRGISPYMEAIKKGEVAYVARDFSGAVTAFQDAIKLDVQKMLGYYRIGEAQLALNNLTEAEAQWQSALTKTGSDDLKSKVLFVLADLRERQGKWQEAKEAWTAYTAFLQSNPKALGYPVTAAERQKMIDRRVKDEKDFGEVRERIKRREAEKIKEAEENAKKDTKNR